MGESPAVRSEETQMSQVDAETTARVIADKRLGDRIRRLRLKKSMGLVELGKLTGLSASFLSQLETGRVVPTLRNLARIAMVFSKDLSYFFESDASAMFRIHRRKERVRLPQTGVESPTYYFESLGYMCPPADGPILCRVHSADRRGRVHGPPASGLRVSLCAGGSARTSARRAAMQAGGGRRGLL